MYYDTSYGVNCELKKEMEIIMLKKDLKKRNWTFVLYEDSCAKDWEDYLIATGVPFSYVYHDKDITEIGEPKKPHYHVLVCFDGPTTYNTMLDHAKRVGAANDVVQPVGSVRGIVRYFCHKDNPDKYQYNEDVIQYRNGFDPSDYFCLTVTQQKAIKRKVTSFIRENRITQYADLINILMDSEEDDMYDIATQNTFFFCQYMKSLKFVKEEN
jgi:hypothetical protein